VSENGVLYDADATQLFSEQIRLKMSDSEELSSSSRRRRRVRKSTTITGTDNLTRTELSDRDVQRLSALFAAAELSSEAQSSYVQLCRAQRLAVADLRTMTRDGLSALGFRTRHQGRVLRALAADAGDAVDSAAVLAYAAADVVAKRLSMRSLSPPPPPSSAPPPPPSTAPPPPLSAEDADDVSEWSESSASASESGSESSSSASLPSSSPSSSSKASKKTKKKAKDSAEQAEWMAAAARGSGDGWRVGPVMVKEGTLLRRWVWHVLSLRDGKLSLFRGPLEAGMPLWSMPADDALELVPAPSDKPGKFTLVVRHARLKSTRQLRVATLAEKQDWIRSIYTRALPGDVLLAPDSDTDATDASDADASAATTPRDVEGEAKLKALTARRDALLTRAAKIEAETVGAQRTPQTVELLTALELQASDLTAQILAEQALQQSLEAPERNRNAMRRRRAAKLARDAVAARRDAVVAVEQCQAAIAAHSSTVAERTAATDARLRDARTAFAAAEQSAAATAAAAAALAAKLADARRDAAQALKERNSLGSQLVMAEAQVAQASSAKVDAARAEAARISAAVAAASRLEQTSAAAVSTLSRQATDADAARDAAAALLTKTRQALAADELSATEQAARDKLESQRRREALTAAQGALERATTDVEAAEAAERAARKSDVDGSAASKKPAKKSKKPSKAKGNDDGDDDEFTLKIDSDDASASASTNERADEWAWDELSDEEQSTSRDAFYLANRERIDSAARRMSLFDGNALLHATFGDAVERDATFVILLARCRYLRRMSAKRARRRRRHRDGTTTSAPERRRATEVENKEGTLLVTKMAIYFVSFDDGAELVKQALAFDDIAELQPVQARRIAARLANGDSVLFSAFPSADVRDEMHLAITNLWTNRREEALLRKYKLSAIQAELEFANLAQEVATGTRSDDDDNDHDDRDNADKNEARGDDGAAPGPPAAAGEAAEPEFTVDVSAILQQEVARFHELFNTPRDEPLVVVCGAKLCEVDATSGKERGGKLSGTLYVAPNYVCFAQDARGDAAPACVRLRWRDVERVERRVLASFVGFLDASVIEIERTGGAGGGNATFQLASLSKNLEQVCDAMRACWLASSRRPALFGVPLRQVWPRAAAPAPTSSGEPSGGDPSDIPGQPVLPLMAALGRRIVALADTEGVFRTSPSQLEAQRTREAIEDAHWNEPTTAAATAAAVAPSTVVVGALPARSGWQLVEQLPVDMCCWLYKNFLRTQAEPLLTFDLFECFMVIDPEFRDEADAADDGTATTVFSRKRAVSEPLASLLRMLPYAHYCALRHVLWLLDAVSQRQATNKMTHQSLSSIFGPVLLRDRQSDQDSALLRQTASRDGTADAATLANASRTAQMRAAEAFQLNYKVSLLLLYVLQNRREVLALAEEDVVRATLALDPPTLPRPPKTNKPVSWRELSVGLRPDGRAPMPPTDKQRAADASSTKKATKSRERGKELASKAAEQLRRKKKALAHKWGKLARSLSNRSSAKDDKRAAAAEQALCQLCHEKKIALRVQFASTADETASLSPEQRMLMLCRECVMCAHCGQKRIAARLTVAVSGKSKAKPAEMGQQTLSERKMVSVYVCGECCAQYESDKAKIAAHRAELAASHESQRAAVAASEKDAHENDSDAAAAPLQGSSSVQDDLDFYGLASDPDDHDDDDDDDDVLDSESMSFVDENSDLMGDDD
jgi:hypothetical protein